MTKSDPQSIFKNTFALILSRVFHLLSSFILGLFLARRLDVVQVGIYSTVFIFFYTTSIISPLGMGSYITRELARNLDQTNRYFVHSVLIVALSSMLIALALGLAVSLFDYIPETILGIRLMALSLLPTSVQIIFQAVFINYERSEFLTFTSLIEMVGRLVISWWLLLKGYGALSLIVVFVIFRFVAMLSLVYFMIRFILRPRWEFDLSFGLRILRESIGFALLNILTGVFTEVESMILSVTHGESAVGLFSVALKLILLWQIFPANFLNSVFPLLSRAYVEGQQSFNELQAKATKYLLVLAAPLMVGTIVCADSVIRFLYGVKYDESVAVLRILGLAIGVMFIDEILWRILLACDHQAMAIKAEIFSIICRTLFAVLLIPSGSYIGTALAWVAGLTAHAVIHWVYVLKVQGPIRLVQLGWRFALAALGMGGLVFFTNQHLHLIVTVLLGSLAYGGLVWLFKGFSEDDIGMFKKAWKPMFKRSKPPAVHSG